LRNEVFISYSHKDAKYLEELRPFLVPFEREYRVVAWDDRHIQPGQQWRTEIAEVLGRAKVAVMLVTANFLASRFITEVELPGLLRAAETAGLRIVWISVSANAFELADFARYQAANDPSKPLDTITAPKRRVAWAQIARTIFNSFQAIENNENNEAKVRRTMQPDLKRPVGALEPNDSLYIERACDAELLRAVGSCAPMIVVEGLRQSGKTSLVVHCLRTKAGGAESRFLRPIYIDLQRFSSSDFSSLATFYRMICDILCDELDLETGPKGVRAPTESPSLNFDRFLRERVLKSSDRRIVLVFDEVDRLFSYEFATDFFGHLRSWNNYSSLSARSSWELLTTVVITASDAPLFISDVRQSPFNLGTRIEVVDFNLAEVTRLNENYGRPLHRDSEIAAFYDLVGGHPFLVSLGLYSITQSGQSWPDFEQVAISEGGPFGSHLRGLLVQLAREPGALSAAQAIARGSFKDEAADSLNWLTLTGVVVRRWPGAKIRCRLYEGFLNRIPQA
jgi:hypothetical protein